MTPAEATRRARGLALAPLAALAVHQLRYLLAFHGAAGRELAEQGHSYLHSLTPWIVLACAAAFGGFLARLARAYRSGRDRPSAPACGVRLWLTASLGLLAIYAGQEFLEGLLASGHPHGLAAIFGDGGLWAIPAALLVGALLALTVRGAAALVALAARSHTAARPRLDLSSRAPRPRLAARRPPAPLASAAAGRAPTAKPPPRA